jgi:hypothetical protein
MLGQIRLGQFAAALLAALVLAFAPAQSKAQTGNVTIELVRAGFIVGVTGGSGTLRFGGKSYALGVGGLSVGATIGAAKVILAGRAYNMRKPSDIAGVYTAAGASGAVLRGGRVTRVQNANGVVLELQGREVGLEFSVDLSGMSISMR